MRSFAFDLRDVLKALRHAPGYAATVVATLALAIGATTAVFSIVNGVLLKPLAYRESHRLVALREIWAQFAGNLEVNERHLFDVQPRDPFVITAVVALVSAIGAAACLVAARQGLAINPAAALREE